MKILFASQNPHKLSEVSKLLPSAYELIGPLDLGFEEEIIEDADTLEGNALIKSRTLFERFKIPAFADDTGLFINALDGEPGVFSARWSAKDGIYSSNIEKALALLEEKEDRSAYFKTVIAFTSENEEHLFEGRVDGHISKELRGEGGFGYDPIFVPEGFEVSFAEMSAEAKNKISHRGRAMEEFMSFLRDQG